MQKSKSRLRSMPGSKTGSCWLTCSRRAIRARLAVLGWSQQFSAWLGQYTDNPWLLVAGFALVFGGVYLIIDLPLSYYSGYVLPHRFNLSTETFLPG